MVRSGDGPGGSDFRDAGRTRNWKLLSKWDWIFVAAWLGWGAFSIFSVVINPAIAPPWPGGTQAESSRWFVFANLLWAAVFLFIVYVPIRILIGSTKGCVLAVGVPGVLCLAFALVLPDLLRPRVSHNESAAIRDVRAVMSAEAAYASLNRGYYDRLECLVRPTECLASYPADRGPFLSEQLDGLRSGFVRRFVPGAPAGADAPSTSALSSYAFVAYPEKVGETGVRSFCGDSDGILCVFVDGSQPAIVDGKCPYGCPLFE